MHIKPRTITSAAAALALALTVTGCAAGAGQATGSAATAAATQSATHTLAAQTLPLKLQRDTTTDVQEGEVTLYFVDGGEIPYVSLEEYLPVIGEVYAGKDRDPLEYQVEIDGDSAMITRADNETMMGIDAATDVLSFGDYDLFVQMPGSTTLIGLVAPGEGSTGTNTLFRDTGFSYSRSGDALIMNLADYNIDLIVQDGAAYMPLQTVSDVLLGGFTYMQTIYNGLEVIVGGYGTELLQEEYDAPTGEMSEDLATFNLNELRFFLDHYYGLAPEHNIDNFGTFLAQAGLVRDMTGTDPQAFDQALAKLIGQYLDDSHSSVTAPSYLAGADTKEDLEMSVAGSTGTSGSGLTAANVYLQNIRSEYYPDLAGLEHASPFLYEEVGDTAIITFDTFLCTKEDYRADADLESPQDTIELIAYAHQQIMREGSPIKNVVIDLSCNTGGHADAAIFTIAWFTRTAEVVLRDTLTGALSSCKYYADINLDGEFDYDDGLPDEINRYCLASGSSFSCGNLVPVAFKNAPNVTLIGSTTGGGSNVVLPATTAIGTMFQISGTTQIGILKNGSFYGADTGVDPDFEVAHFSTLYDRQALVDYIHGLK